MEMTKVFNLLKIHHLMDFNSDTNTRKHLVSYLQQSFMQADTLKISRVIKRKNMKNQSNPAIPDAKHADTRKTHATAAPPVHADNTEMNTTFNVVILSKAVLILTANFDLDFVFVCAQKTRLNWVLSHVLRFIHMPALLLLPYIDIF